MPKINYNKAFTAMHNGDKLPRKAKKALLGKRVNKSRLKKLLDSVVVVSAAKTMYGDGFEIKPCTFCPKCGCEHERGTGNMTTYPEHWEHFYCVRCGFLVGIIDNSPYMHCLEFKEWNYKIDY